MTVTCKNCGVGNGHQDIQCWGCGELLSALPARSTADHQIQMHMLMDDKTRLADALKEIYSIRGEDNEIERIVNEALLQGNVVGG